MNLKKYFIDFSIIFLIFLFDRVTKILVINSLNSNSEISYQLNSYIDLNLIWNSGIAFGLLSFDEIKYYNLLTIIIILVTAVIFWMIIKTEGIEKIGFMMIFGGSLGNIFDRIYYSSVPDFIDIHINNFHWFIFNVADIFITLGVILLICQEIFVKRKI
tara:strand:+ start:48 stop:524 length:477 start_codon:yes stop_codon:yes gene_type:complete